MYASPRPLSSTTAGTTYLLSAYVRSATPGKKVCLRAREYAGTSIVRTVTTCASATSSWAKLAPVAYTALRSGSSVDVDLYQGSAVSGDSFEADGVVLTLADTSGANIVPNGDFESGVTGWGKSSATLASVTGGVVGPGAARATVSGTATTYRMYATPRPIASTTAGTTYLLWAYVRSNTPGKRVCLRAREYSGTSVVRTVTTCVTATSSWVKLAPVAYTALRSGSSVDVDLYQSSAVSGNSFDADGVALVRA